MDTTPPREQVKKSNLTTHVTELTRNGSRHKSNPTGVSAALTYLKAYLSTEGYTVQEEKYGTGAHEVNLCCELAGTGTGEVLEVAAHWDTVEHSPGADDNASGVAGVLEAARVLAADHKLKFTLARTVRFCLFGGEEDQPDLCTGSRYHVDKLKAAPYGVIVLEMIGCQKTAPNSQQIPAALKSLPGVGGLTVGDFIAAIGLADAAAHLSALSSAATAHKMKLVPIKLPLGDYSRTDVARSDHFPYWRKSLPGVMVTDTANFRYPDYHKSTDTIDKIDFDFAAQVTAAVVDAVRELAK